jgi:hypothetical protein
LLDHNFPYNTKVQHASRLRDNDRFALIRCWAADAEPHANDSDDPGSDDLDSDDVPYGNSDDDDDDDDDDPDGDKVAYGNFLHYVDFEDDGGSADEEPEPAATKPVESEEAKLRRELKQERGRATRLAKKVYVLQRQMTELQSKFDEAAEYRDSCNLSVTTIWDAFQKLTSYRTSGAAIRKFGCAGVRLQGDAGSAGAVDAARKLHVAVYQHRTVKNVGHMIGDALLLAEPHFEVDGRGARLRDCIGDEDRS